MQLKRLRELLVVDAEAVIRLPGLALQPSAVPPGTPLSSPVATGRHSLLLNEEGFQVPDAPTMCLHSAVAGGRATCTRGTGKQLKRLLRAPLACRGP